ncbi:MAG TPA: sugar O-acetyltransferase [Candidatus Sumerlaeota bacterium]|nr:sugar O-acetyltransferase [Candidatus Sumerlaeota bacterium]HOR26786.1 sugar O-acetyltransferase [Candidatus Sumerlaeota bacterium]HPK01302.1 sugar O-acetyltransferase [Candidatus Sumerlaeota bacterium]
MLAGQLYLASDPELVAERLQARRLLHRFNLSAPDESALREATLRELFGRIGPSFSIEPPFYCDYGYNILADDGLYMNFGCVVLDVCPVHIGAGVMFGPYVQVYAAHHPLDARLRCAGPELGSPVWIEDRVWVGGGAKICPGVRIGRDSVIGAGSVVTRDIPPGVVAAGNPCRVLRDIPAGDLRSPEELL